LTRCLASLVCFGVVCTAAPVAAQTVSDGRFVMGTVLEISLVAANSTRARAEIDARFAQAAELEAIFSRFSASSDVSRLTSAAGGAPLAIDPRTRELLNLASEYAQVSGGVFDVTVGPLVELWSAAARRGELPSDVERQAAIERVGYEDIRLHDDGRAALARPRMAIDLGGIAKGYALDRMVAALRAEGWSEALLSFGQSSVWALGAPPGETGWRLLLRAPEAGSDASGPAFGGVLTVRDLALSVSSSLGQWSKIEGVRYGHVIDPRGGQPVRRGRQAAVVAQSATRAEALSTALVVLDEEEGLALVEALSDVECLLVDESGEWRASSGWQRVTDFQHL